MTLPLHPEAVTRMAEARLKELNATRRQRVAQRELSEFEPRDWSDLRGCAVMIVCSFLGSLVWLALGYVIFSTF